MSHSEQAGHGEQEHATIKTYVLVAVLLAVITAIEIAIPQLPHLGLVAALEPRWLYLGAMYTLALVKFGYVVAFFMHLRYDAKLYTYAFVFAMVIALGTFLALLALSPRQTPRMAEVAALNAPAAAAPAAHAAAPAAASAPTGAAAAAAAPSAPGDAAAGKVVFSNTGCIACHQVDDVAGAVGTTGPALDGLADRAADRRPGLDAEAYIRESVKDPMAFTVEGFLNVMPPIGAALPPQDFENLIAFLKTL